MGPPDFGRGSQGSDTEKARWNALDTNPPQCGPYLSGDPKRGLSVRLLGGLTPGFYTGDFNPRHSRLTMHRYPRVLVSRLAGGGFGP